jgi:hypothetical protein
VLTGSTTVLGSSPNPSTYGQAVTLTATISPPSATGTVTFYLGATRLGASAVNDGTASITLSTLPTGSQSLTAAYSGDSNDTGSTSPLLVQVVQKVITAIRLTSVPDPSARGETITLTAAVVPPTVTGAVTFFTGKTVLGAGVPNGGVATLTISTLPAGVHNLAAVYDGDKNDLPSTSPVRKQVVK